MDNRIEVDLENSESVSAVLDYLTNDFDSICKTASANGGIEYGRIISNSFDAYEIKIHDEIPSYSELAFFMKAVENEENTSRVSRYVQIAAERNNKEKIWFDDEMPMGLNAAFALAGKDKKYIDDFIDLLRTCDMDHEVYQCFFIDLLLDKWKICDETLNLLAARSGSIVGQFGLEDIEKYEIDDLTDEQKSYYFKCLMEDSLKSPAVYPDLLIDAMELLDINVDQDKFSDLFDGYSPAFDSSGLPVLYDVI